MRPNYCIQCGVELSRGNKKDGTKLCYKCYSQQAARASGVLMEARGVNRRIQLLDDRVRIVRKGVISFATQGIKGDKEVLINQIGAIKFKKAGLTAGYMSFTFLGGQEYKGSVLGSAADENGVIFYSHSNGVFESMKAAIERKMGEARRPVVQQMQQPSAYDELAKLAVLRDQGVVTEEEFQEQKKEATRNQNCESKSTKI